MAWFMFPASMVVGTVLLSQTERTNKGILKMLALPISTVKLCLAKFVVLLALAASQILMMVGMYYISAAIVTGTQDYNFILSPLFVFKEGWLYSCFNYTDAGVFLVACGMYSNPDFFHRHWFSFHCTVSSDD
ncbi:MAG: ABC transporter permease [[Clostridium] leptum]